MRTTTVDSPARPTFGDTMRLHVPILLLATTCGFACGDKTTTSPSAAAVTKAAAPAGPAAGAATAKPTVDPVEAARIPDAPPVPPSPDVDPRSPPVPADSLAAELRAKLAAYRARAPKESQAVTDKAIAALGAGTMLRDAKNIDDVAPDFTLPDATGKLVKLSDLLKKGPVVLTWYRGGWCPYCNITLRRYAKLVPELAKVGATLVAVSPDTPDKSLSTVQKHKLPMVVLSDAGLKVARSYGLVYQLPPELKARYDKAFDLKAWGGTDKGELPLAAAYVIHPDGRIRYAFLDADYRRRAEPAELLAAVRARAAPPTATPGNPGDKLAEKPAGTAAEAVAPTAAPAAPGVR